MEWKQPEKKTTEFGDLHDGDFFYRQEDPSTLLFKDDGRCICLIASDISEWTPGYGECYIGDGEVYRITDIVVTGHPDFGTGGPDV